MTPLTSVPESSGSPIRRLSPRTDRNGETGSAYLVALLVLVILSMLGLSLALVTQTETQIAANERATTRLFYGADAGIPISIALGLTDSDFLCNSWLPNQGTLPGGSLLREVVNFTPLVQIDSICCNLCECNEGEGPYKKSSHAQRSNAAQLAVDGGVTTTLTQKSVGIMVDFEPLNEVTLALLYKQLFTATNECGIGNLPSLLN